MSKEIIKPTAVKKTNEINIRKTAIRSICLLFTLLLIHTSTMAQPPIPVETDTLAPFVTSTSITAFTTTTATLSGKVTGDGGAAVTERGVVYSTANILPTVGDTKVVIGSGLGTYSQTVTGLTGGTLYYVRAYATNIIGTSYGAMVSLTTNAVAPGIITNEISAITNTTATAGGTISFSGGATVTERGVVYSSSSTTPTVADIKLVIGAGTGTYSGGLSGLVLGTTYYVRAYAINSAGTSYGSVFSFIPAGASVSTDFASVITTNSARMGGNVTSIGGSAVTDRGVVYVAGSNTPTLADTKISMGAGIGTFSQTVSSLLPATTYSVRAYATNTATTNYGAVQTFTTQTTLASINRVEASPTNLNTVTYTVSFAQSITGLTAANFAITTTGSITNAYVTAVIGSGTTWNVTVYTGRNSGTITLIMVNADGIAPLLSNTLPITGEVFVIDKAAPAFSFVSIRSSNADTTLAKTGDVVTLSFNLTKTTTTPVVTIAGQTASVISTGTGKWAAGYTMKNTDVEGTVVFTINAGDLIGNVAATAIATSNSTTATFDRTAPAINSINRVSASPTNATTVQYTVTFSEPVLGVDVSDFTVTTTLVTGASVASISGSGSVYTVTVNTGSGNGTMRLDLNSSGTAITDPAGNSIGGYTGGQVYTIAKILTKPIVKTNDPAYSCGTVTVDLTAAAVTAGSDPALTYAYYRDAAATTTLTIPAAVSATGTYYITGTNILNITSDPVAVNVTVYNFTNPKAGFTFDSYCISKAVNFTNTSTIAGTGAVSYQWSDNNAHTSTSASPSFTYAATGGYNVKLKVFSQLCPLVADSVTQVVTISSPAPGVRIPTMSVVLNDQNQLQARTTVGNIYQWAPAKGLSSTTIANPTVKLAQQTAYTITMTATSGCQTVDSLLINTFERYIYVPNVFSPNGDNINDVLYINLISAKELHYFRVFNRYSKQVFETTNPAIGWDGKVRGQLQGVDTYVWIAEIVTKDNKQATMQGTVTILK
jgi:gliding motility-associated-like protein